MSEVLEIEDTGQFYDLLDTEKVMVVKFTAPARCAPCRAFRPHFEKVAEAAKKDDNLEFRSVTFVYLNVDDFPDIAMDYGIMQIPTVLLFRDGKTTNTLVERNAPKFRDEIKTALRS